MPVSVATEAEFNSLVSAVSAISNRVTATEQDIAQLKIQPALTGFYWPGYVYPTSTLWTTFLNKAKANPTKKFLIAINPSSGVGSAKDTNYVNGITLLRTAPNILIIGYVYTSYGARSDAAIKDEIDKYKLWYGIDGIFFDEMSNTAGKEQYYKDKTTYIHSIGMKLVMGNPGTDTSSSYVGTVDNIIIYERANLPSVDLVKGWHLNYDKKNFAIIPYAVTTLTQQQVKDFVPYVGWIYVTNDGLPNPWDSLSTHTDTILSAL